MAGIQELLEGARDAMAVSRVFGEPIERNDVTVIPAVAVRGGGGGGSGKDTEHGEGVGGGFGMTARPVGAYVIRVDSVEWQPAFDLVRLGMAGIVLAGLAILTIRTAIKRRTK
jgi:uncharacterized spore protein YtfJ